jgi:hypothetical protein
MRRLFTGGTMKIDISNGELVDRVTILALKNERICGSAGTGDIAGQLARLRRCMHRVGVDERSRLYRGLLKVNGRLWETEDRLRERERHGRFDGEFIELARSVYTDNDRRSALKRKIDRLTHSRLTERKQYTRYHGTAIRDKQAVPQRPGRGRSCVKPACAAAGR